MKFRRIISVVLLLCMLFSLTACKTGGSQSKKVTKALMDALYEYDINAISECIEDFPDNTGTAYIHDIYTEDYYKDLYTAANKSMSYEIVSASGKAVTVKVKMPDLYALYQKTFSSIAAQALGNDQLMQYVLDDKNDAHLLVIAYMIKDIEDNGVSTTEQEIKLFVSKINGEYKIKTDENLEKLLTSGLNKIQIDLPVAEETTNK